MLSSLSVYAGAAAAGDATKRSHLRPPKAASAVLISAAGDGPLRRCSCCRRRLLGALISSVLKPSTSLAASNGTDQTPPKRPTRPDWYQELYAKALDIFQQPYEDEVGEYKQKLFFNLNDTERLLDIGVGTGPNFKYYTTMDGLSVYGVDPNKYMEEYARNAAKAAGFPLSKFYFLTGVGELLPVADNSMDAVVATLLLCSVGHVEAVLKEIIRVLKPGGRYLFLEHVAAADGSLLRYLQRVFDPLQQLVADGCHLTRETGRQIQAAGFSTVELNAITVPNVFIFGPHIYGVAHK